MIRGNTYKSNRFLYWETDNRHFTSKRVKQRIIKPNLNVKISFFFCQKKLRLGIGFVFFEFRIVTNDVSFSHFCLLLTINFVITRFFALTFTGQPLL